MFGPETANKASAQVIHFRWSGRHGDETMCSLCSNWWNTQLNSVDTTSQNVARRIKKAFQSWGVAVGVVVVVVWGWEKSFGDAEERSVIPLSGV